MVPASSRLRRWVFVAIVAIGVGFCLAALFAKIRWAEAVGFIPAVQGTIFVADMAIAVWLFAQVSLTRSRALLVLASGYLFTALIVFAQTLTFPGAFAPQGLFGAGLQTSGWLLAIWNFSFPGAVIAYVLLKGERIETNRIRVLTRCAIFRSIAGVIVLACAIVWGLTAADERVPALFLDRVTFTPFVFYAGAFDAVVCAIAFLCLLSRKRSVLDELLIVSVAATMAEMTMLTFFSAGRYDVGWYAVRLYGVVAANAVFLALFAEFTWLHANMSTALRAVRRERDSKLLSTQTGMAALAHEIRQPLSAIVLNADASLAFLQKTPPDLDEVRECLEITMREAHHLDEMVAAIRKLFRDADRPEQPIDMNDFILSVLGAQRHDLARRGVRIRYELMPGFLFVRGHKTQIEEVVVNLAANAADAMAATASRHRVLTARTQWRDPDAVSVEIEDTGPGIDPRRLNEIFDPFVTTKSEGLGLGLAICRRIIEQHGGELNASSDGKNGTTFRFVLPAMRPTQSAERTEQSGRGLLEPQR